MTVKRTLLIALLWTAPIFAHDASPSAHILPDESETPRMKKWIDMHYGLFISFGMNTMVGAEHVPTKQDPKKYAPQALDVDSWIHAAKDGGMKYAVLTAKHDSGFCLWDSKVQFHGKEFDYDVAASGNKTDVVRAFVNACKKYDVVPGIYYCLPDSYSDPAVIENNKFNWGAGKLSEDAFELVKAHLDELATNYPECHYFWLDAPKAASVPQLQAFYDLLRRKNPENVVLFNSHLGCKDDGAFERTKVDVPADVINTEARPVKGVVPKWQRYHDKKFYIGYEHCDEIGRKWFNSQGLKSTDSLFALYQRVRRSGGNLLLDIGPRKDGSIPKVYVDALKQLKEKIEPFEESLKKGQP